MPFSTETEQIKKFENDEVAQHYFEVLRTLISKNRSLPSRLAFRKWLTIWERFLQLQVPRSWLTTAILLHLFWRSFSSNPAAKTIIFYNHYDTVPADDDQPWTNDPFTLSVHYGVMWWTRSWWWQGHITARLTAVRKYIRTVICQSISSLWWKGRRVCFDRLG